MGSAMNTLRFFNPYEEIRFTENLLPHWQQEGGTYFITFRLADSIPAHLREQWEDEREIWLRFHPKPWTPETDEEYHKRFRRCNRALARCWVRFVHLATKRLRCNRR